MLRILHKFFSSPRIKSNSSLWLGDDTALASLFLSTQTCWETLSRNAAASCPHNSRSSEDRSFNCFQSTLKCPPNSQWNQGYLPDCNHIAPVLFSPHNLPFSEVTVFPILFYFIFYLDYDLSSPLEHKFHRTGTLSILNA